MSGKSQSKRFDLNKVISHQISLWNKPKILEKYSYIHHSDFKDLERGLTILRISQDEFKMPWVTAEEISALLIDVFKVGASPIAIKRAFAKAGGANKAKKHAISKKELDNIYYKLSQPGEVYINSVLGRGLLKVLFLEPNTSGIAYREIHSLIGSLKGKELKVLDPYYGLSTLDVLEEILRANKKVKFISYKTNESTLKFKREIKYLQKHYPKMIEMRIYPKDELHDRYIISDDSFVIVGQGIKDLGKKESFVVVIDDRLARDTRKELEKSFWKKWQDPTCQPV